MVKYIYKMRKEVETMKATGIVRHIDDLGRVVIPKEIRRSLKIREGDPLEIFTEDDKVVFAKYDPNPSKEEDAQTWLRNMKDHMDKQGVRFSIDGDTTTCEGIRDNRRMIGIAKRDPKDPFSPAVGMVWAYCRAFDVDCPIEDC